MIKKWPKLFVLNSPGSVDGIPGSLSRREADYSAIPLSMSEERKLACDYTVQFDNYLVGLVGQPNEKAEVSYFAFVLLFTWKAWCAVGLFSLTMTTCLFLLGEVFHFREIHFSSVQFSTFPGSERAHGVSSIQIDQ